MKRLLITIVFVLVLATSAFAAGTITGSSELNQNIMRVTYTITFGADASSPANVALDSITSSTGARLRTLGGWWLLRVDTLFGATGPTDDTDIYLYYPAASKADVFGGSGVNTIDNATNNSFYPATVSQPLTGSEILSISGNAVNDAIVTIIFTLYK